MHAVYDLMPIRDILHCFATVTSLLCLCYISFMSNGYVASRMNCLWLFAPWMLFNTVLPLLCYSYGSMHNLTTICLVSLIPYKLFCRCFATSMVIRMSFTSACFFWMRRLLEQVSITRSSETSLFTKMEEIGMTNGWTGIIGFVGLTVLIWQLYFKSYTRNGGLGK